MIMHMLFDMLFEKPPCTNLMEVKSVNNDLIGKIVTYLQVVCHFITVKCLPPLIMAQACSMFLSVCHIEGHSDSSTSVDTYLAIF
jgi:hypothetical protein